MFDPTMLAGLQAPALEERNECYIYNADGTFRIKMNYKPSEMLANPSWYSEWEEGMHVLANKLNHPKICPETGVPVEKERYELIQEGLDTLRPGEYLDGTTIIEVARPEGLYEYVWDDVNHVWKEGKTPEEIEEIKHAKHVQFYNDELALATKATAELQCGIITSEDFQPVADYMKSIDPYAPAVVNEAPKMRGMMLFALPGAPQTHAEEKAAPARPSIFDRYK